MKHFLLTILIISNILFMSSCHTTKSVTGNSGTNEMLYQSEWKLIEVQGQPVPESSKASLSFIQGEVNRVAGNAGCNRINGSYDLKTNNSIIFSPMATTRMACLDSSVNEIENKFLAAITKTTSWSIADNQLLLKNGETILAKFNGRQSAAKADIKLNGSWELNYISGPRIAFDGLYPNKKPTLVFNLAASEVNGNSSCNGFSSKVTIDGNKIRFGDALSTRMACEGNGEQLFFETLKKITSYSVSDGNTLNLIMGDIAMMRFVRK